MVITENDWDNLFSGEEARVRESIQRFDQEGEMRQLLAFRRLNPRFVVGDLADLFEKLRSETFGDFSADEFPQEVMRFQWLISLRLKLRTATSLPRLIENFPKLKHLGLEVPLIKAISLSWNGLPSLESLTISNSMVEAVEIDLHQHPSLTELVIFCCDLKEVPNGIDQLVNLNLYRNPRLNMVPWPDRPLSRLDGLNLSETQVSFLPDILGYFPCASVIRIEGTPMVTLPPAIATWGDQLEVFASRSQIRDLPESLLTASNIKTLHLVDTPYSKMIRPEGIRDLQARKDRPRILELHAKLKERFEIVLD
jgi:hypothetical protein